MRSGPGCWARSLTGRYAEGGLLPSSHVARRADLAYRSGRVAPPQCGVPVSVKDLLDVAGLPTGRGRAGDAPAAVTDSPVAEAERRAGADGAGSERLPRQPHRPSRDQSDPGTDSDGVSLGLQLIGRRGRGRALLEVAGLLEAEAARSRMTRVVRQ